MARPLRSRVTSTKSPSRTKKRTTRAKKGQLVIPAALQPLVAALSKQPGVTVEKGWGSSNIAFKCRSKIFAMSIKDEMVFKLPKTRVDELVDGSKGTRFDPRRNGSVMREWLVVPAGSRNRMALATEAYAFVAGNRGA